MKDPYHTNKLAFSRVINSLVTELRFKDHYKGHIILNESTISKNNQNKKTKNKKKHNQ